jgi:hypothetical protein
MTSISEQVFTHQNDFVDQATTFAADAQGYLNDLEAIAHSAAANPTSIINALTIDDAAINAKLAWLDSDAPHGFSAAIEQQIFDRARERTISAATDAVRQIKRRASASGWEQPLGAMFEKISEAEQGVVTAVSGHARDVAIQQAQLEIDAFRLLLNSLLQLMQAAANLDTEKVRMTLANTQSSIGLLMEAAKAGSQIATQLGASALSTMNFNSSVSGSMSASVSHSDSVSYDGGNGSPPILILDI